MNKRQRPSRRKKSASVGIVLCFVAAIAIVGTYTLRDYRDAQRQELELAKLAKEKEEEKKEQAKATNNLVIDTKEKEKVPPETETATPETKEPSTAQQTAGESTSVNFSEETKLLWPVSGNILLNYSMDKTVYFSTLDQYKYNPALVISGAEGDQVICGTTGIVKSIDVTAQTGTTVNIDIGNGYELFYGQLKEVPVKVGDYVESKTVLGYVSQPTKYYSVEGCNVYFEMRKDGQTVNPMDYLAQ